MNPQFYNKFPTFFLSSCFSYMKAFGSVPEFVHLTRNPSFYGHALKGRWFTHVYVEANLKGEISCSLTKYFESINIPLDGNLTVFCVWLNLFFLLHERYNVLFFVIYVWTPASKVAHWRVDDSPMPMVKRAWKGRYLFLLHLRARLFFHFFYSRRGEVKSFKFFT